MMQSVMAASTNATTITTNLTTTSNYTTQNGSAQQLITIIIPLSVVLSLATIIVAYFVYKKHKLKRKRIETLRRNKESGVSWFDGLEFPQTSKTFNDFSEQTEFSIPMGPLQHNNYAFDSFDSSIKELTVSERYSSQKRLDPAYNCKSKNCKRGDIFPIDDNILANHNSR